eukprot:CAMPEP_0206230000 /NCGR_PEP_ID=MMETSP0047_2-20121206/10005_1 /ASSEMBLY_ACC=CAM_ASM_000192 /TAXON_ID=195065 /ORGANISM="Chroomonas mesostigmatica_cf, Strain CCMP1168" /LENGTH=694 /DNA_ID=CAMNT_0053653353 /DNA_START=30 /DNA_END=2114 /DNA_ORIENTATION=+
MAPGARARRSRFPLPLLLLWGVSVLPACVGFCNPPPLEATLRPLHGWSTTTASRSTGALPGRATRTPLAQAHARRASRVCMSGAPRAARFGSSEAYQVEGAVKGVDGQMHEMFVPPSRDAVKERMRTETFDVLVIGGGATGAGVAQDAALRGLSVALVDKRDFASGTSSKSTKLIHGGLRYLALAFQKEIPPKSPLDVLKNLHYDHSMMKVVTEDLKERAFMLQSAPFMTRPLALMIPIKEWWEFPMMFIVGKMYDFIAGSRRAVPASHVIWKEETLAEFPGLQKEKIQGAVVLYDGQQNDARMCMHIILTAAESGAACLNHAEVIELLSEGKPGEAGYCITGAAVREAFTGEVIQVKAKQVINAAGPFADQFRKMADPSAQSIIVPSKGSHVMFPGKHSAKSMGCVWFTEDGRVLYLLPWEGSTLAGTTDLQMEVTEKPSCTPEEVDFIIRECNSILDPPLQPQNVLAAWAGLRPLVRDPKAAPGDTKGLARGHVVDLVDGGLVSICGGKWTTYRKMAEDAVDAAVRLNDALKHAKPCGTHALRVVGSDRGGVICGGHFERLRANISERHGLDADVAAHLVSNYGTRALQVLQLARRADGEERMPRLCDAYPFLEAEVVFAVRHEYALTAVDVMARRMRLAFLDERASEQALDRVLHVMQEELEWDSTRKAEERQAVVSFLQQNMQVPQLYSI